MIEKLNTEFIPLEVNISDDGWPDNIPCLWLWKLYHKANPISKFGFTAMMIVTPDGKTMLEAAQSAGAENWANCEQYHGEKLVELLDKSMKKFKARR